MEAIGLTLTTRPRRRIPALASLATPGYLGDFELMYAEIVGLHIHAGWDAAKVAFGADSPIVLARNPENEVDPNAVCCYIEHADGEPRQMIGYLGAEYAVQISAALAEGATLQAVPAGRPWAGSGSRGGTLSIAISLDEA